MSLGLLWDRPTQLLWELTKASAEPDAEEIERMIRQRDAARRQRDWAQADAIRESLSRRGIILEDGPNGTNWRLRIEKPE
jgi:cysteinyl-tRNA synthetase